VAVLFMEIWKDVKGYEGLYQVSNQGNLLIIKKSRLAKPLLVKNGYLLVDLYKGGIKKRISLHRLVLLTFIKNTQNKSQVNHINGIKTYNRIENLEWCTASENQIHSLKTGLRRVLKGEDCDSKLTESQARIIKYGLKSLTQKNISDIYNISRVTVSDIRRGKSWKHI
jgi:hypothetical protein